jgi:hypothetical protein
MIRAFVIVVTSFALSGCAAWNAPVSSDYRCQTMGIGTKYAKSYCTENGRVTYIQSKPYRNYKR